jgi:CRISPR-associated protein Csm4
MQVAFLRCPPNSRFHFGTPGLDENASLHQTSEWIHSDTLFSSILNTCAKVFSREETSSLFEAFQNGDINLSSAFYVFEIKNSPIEEGPEVIRKLFFLPKPDYLNLFISDHDQRKELGKVKFISQGIWEKGITPENWIDSSGCIIIDKKFVLLKEELDADYDTLKVRLGNSKPENDIKIYEVETVPKIADHSRRWEDNIFFQTDLLLEKSILRNKDGAPLKEIQPHFYFFLDFDENTPVGKILNLILLDILPDEGIGGAISTGCGKIEDVQFLPFQFSIENQSEEKTISASLTHPGAPEELAQFTHYKLLTRGGRATASFGHLKRVKMIKEGALINGLIEGGIPKLHGSEPFYRYGRVYPLPLHQNFDRNA